MAKASKKHPFQDRALLHEKYTISDALNYSPEVERLEDLLSRTTDTSLIAFVAGYGSGKSTLLWNVSKKAKSKSSHWLFFESWKYPNRDLLWEGFVLDFVQKFDKRLYQITKNKIDGQSNGISLLWNGLANILVTIGALFTPLQFLISFQILSVLSHFDKNASISRVGELQALLKAFIEKKFDSDDEINIVLEDVDRSSDKGVYFLETVAFFFREMIDSGIKFNVIVPVSEFRKMETRDQLFISQQVESYLKVFDYIFELKHESLDFTPFIKRLLGKKKIDQEVKSIANVVNSCRHNFRISTRLVKVVFRMIDVIYQDKKYRDLDVAVLFSICCAKLFEKMPEVGRTQLQKIKGDKNHYKISKGNRLGHVLQSAQEAPKGLDFFFIGDEKLVTAKTITTASEHQHFHGHGDYLSLRYLEAANYFIN